MVRPSANVRRMTKKLRRVVSNDSANGDADGNNRDVMTAISPAPVDTQLSNTLTKRERLLLRTALVRKPSTATAAIVSASLVKLAPAQAGEVAASAVKKKQGGAAVSVGTNRSRTSATVKERHDRSRKSPMVTGKGKKVQRMVKNRQVQRNPVTHKAPRPASMTHATQYAKELEQFKFVQETAAFQDDPFTAIAAHLDSTLDRLQPRTADCGIPQDERARKAEAARQRWRERHHVQGN